MRTGACQADGLGEVQPWGGDMSLGVITSYGGQADFGKPSSGQQLEGGGHT